MTSSPIAPVTPTRLQRIKAVFDEAIERAPETRAAYVIAASGEDAELRREVESLLDALDTMRDALERPAMFSVARIEPELADVSRVGQRVGPYVLRREIGHGGMGTVYEAVRADDHFEQRVAIKLIKRGMDSEVAIRRFRAERQILARLTHRNIAALLDGGVAHDGQPYFVMEYVEGESILHYCDQRGLGIRERLALFQQVCTAVQYAHQSLVVHRDLKPSNILVAVDGSVKLLDFGIAKLLRDDEGEAHESQQLTRAGGRVLTPEYAAPEHLRGLPITTAADVYSLGVILYELLTGTRPFRAEGRTFSELESLICDTDPPRPSAAIADETAAARGERRATRLRAQLAGDIDSIVLTALRKEPERRYASAERLAADVRRHLEGRTVSAQRDWAGYRLMKFARRNVAEVAAGALVVLSLVGGIAATSHQARVAERERQKAAEINAFLTQMLSSVSPDEQGKDVTVRQVLDAASARVDSSLRDQPEIAAELRRTIGQSYLKLGLFGVGERQLRAALGVQRAIHGRSSLPVASTLSFLAGALEGRGDDAGAERMYREALGIFRAADSSAITGEIATTLDDIARMRSHAGDAERAERLQREALAMRRRLYGNVHPRVAQSLNNLSVVYGNTGRYAAAESLQREALSIIRQTKGNDHAMTAAVLSTLASLLDFQGKVEAADSMYRAAIALRRKTLGAEHPDYASTLFNYAGFLYDRGRYADALAASREVVALRGKTLPELHPAVSSSLQTMGRCLDSLGDLTAGGEALRESLRLRRKAYPADHWLVATAESVWGEHLVRLGKYAQAESVLKRSYAVLVKTRGQMHPRTVDARMRVAALYTAWGKAGQAARYH
jgi:eukaryotic-like serine/threonine-protein kinase